MRRKLFLWIPFGLLLLAGGCTMCANTYDECGPTVTAGCAGQCNSIARAGSALSGGPAVSGGMIGAPDGAQFDGAEQAPEKVPNVTDRKARPSAQAAPSSEEGPSPETNGWKSKAPTKAPARLMPAPEK